MLNTLSQPDRTKLEGDILQAICGWPLYYDSIQILDSYFSNKFTKAFWLSIKELKENGHEFDFVRLAQKFTVEEMGFLFDPSRFGVSNYSAFIEAVKLLEEDYKKNELNKLFDNCQFVNEFLKGVRKIEDIGTSTRLQSLEEQFGDYQESYLKRRILAEQRGTTGLLYEWKDLSEIVRLEPSELVVVGARTSIGKTAFSLDLAIQASYLDQRVLFVTMEMSTVSVIDRIVSNVTKNHLRDIKNSKPDIAFIQNELKAISKNLYLEYLPNATTDTVANLVTKMHFDLVIVDYLQLLRDAQNKGEMEVYRIGRVLKNLKRIAGQNNCVVLIPSQLNRDSEKQNRKPTLADLRDSGCIEQDADVILLIHREERDSVLANILVAKNRNGKSGVEVEMKYSPSQNIFKEIPKQNTYAQVAMG